jgi:glyoxylase-like metal-dependent hydrolase (beta-lactamase superfamily II)
VTTWQVGAVRITKLPQMTWHVPLTAFVPDARPDAAPGVLADDGQIDLSLHGLLVETGDRRIVVDTCAGHDDGSEAVLDLVRRGGSITEHHPSVAAALEATGRSVGEIDTVVCTHLHFDHVGGNVTDDGDLSFPSARYVLAGDDWDYWRANEADGQYRSVAHAVTPVVEAGAADLVDPGHVLTDEVRLVPTPGHTPGHVSVRISSGGEEAVITGDVVHHPIELFEPTWPMIADVDPARATTTRRSFADEFGDGATLVLGTHFGGTSAGRLHAAERRWEPV